MTNFRTAAIAMGLIFFSPALVGESFAQTSSTTAAPNMWGTVPSGVSVLGALDSAIAHAQNGLVAGQVNSARSGLLLGQSVNIQSIGSQSIIQNTISGNNNSATATGTQTTTNSGSVSNTGTVN